MLKSLKKLIVKKFEIFDLLSLVPALYFLFATFGYWGETPSLDPLEIYKESIIYHKDGLDGLSKVGNSVHPPLIYIINSLGFTIFGKNPWSLNLMGFLIFLVTSVGLYFFLKKIFSKKIALISTVILFCNPLIIVNSFNIGNDFLILCGIIWCSILYTLDKKILFSLALTLLVLMKETALIVIVSFFLFAILEIVYSVIKRKFSFKNSLFKISTFLPTIIVYITWKYIISKYGITEWSQYIFVENAKSSTQTVIDNIFQFRIFNEFFYTNLVNIFIKNFQWFFTLLLILLSIFKFKVFLKLNSLQSKLLLLSITISIIYVLLVLSFQTWTILRYGIPILFSTSLLLGILIENLNFKVIKYIIFSLIFCIILFSTFWSNDPVTNRIYTVRYPIHDINFYENWKLHSGIDSFAYNEQILLGMKRQNTFINNALNSKSEILITTCGDFKLGMKLFYISLEKEYHPQFKKYNHSIWCTDIKDIAKDNMFLNGKSIYVKRSELYRITQELMQNGVKDYKLTVGDDF